MSASATNCNVLPSRAAGFASCSPRCPLRVGQSTAKHQNPARFAGLPTSSNKKFISLVAKSTEDDLAAAFKREIANRTEVADAQEFDGTALLALLQERYGRSYDVALVQRYYLGRTFIAFNVMWKYMEQQSFNMTQEEYMERLDGVALALREWGVVGTVKREVMANKSRPRVGKAISVMLDVDERVWAEWFLSK